MRKTVLTGAAVAVLSIVGANAAHAAACQARSEVLAKLESKYSETPVAIGMASNGGVLEVLATDADAGTFTIIVTMPNGISCMLASGQHFEMLPEQTAKKAGDPA